MIQLCGVNLSIVYRTCKSGISNNLVVLVLNQWINPVYTCHYKNVPSKLLPLSEDFVQNLGDTGKKSTQV